MARVKWMMGGGLAAAQAKAIVGSTVNTSLASAGSVQGDATLVGTEFAIVTGADGTKGVILPAGEVGDRIYIMNSSASTLKVYPPSGAAIGVPGTGLGSANASYAHTTQAFVEYTCVSATQWFVSKSA